MGGVLRLRGVPQSWTPRSRSVRPARSCFRCDEWESTISRRPQPETDPGARRAADADPVRQAGPDAVHVAPGLRPGVGARRFVRAGGADRVLPGLHSAPEDFVCERGADRGGQRGGVPGDRVCGRPRRSGSRSPRRWTRRCPRAGRHSRRWCAESVGAAWPTGSTRRRWRIETAGVDAEAARRGGAMCSSRPTRSGRAADQDRGADRSTLVDPWSDWRCPRRPTRHLPGSRVYRVRYWTLSYGTSPRPCDPMTS